jgi:hypothetical protein
MTVDKREIDYYELFSQAIWCWYEKNLVKSVMRSLISLFPRKVVAEP